MVKSPLTDQKLRSASKRIWLTTLAFSIALSWISHDSELMNNIGHGSVLHFSTASLLERISGKPASTFVAGTVLLIIPNTMRWHAALFHVVFEQVRSVSRWKILKVVVAFSAVAAFCIWILAFLPEGMRVGGGRFSAMLIVSARHWLPLGVIFGAISCTASFFLAWVILMLRHQFRME